MCNFMNNIDLHNEEEYYNGIHTIDDNEKHVTRFCDNCGKKMYEGYCIENGFEYYCSDECLHKHYTEEEFLNMYNDGEGDSYYTEWESEDY